MPQIILDPKDFDSEFVPTIAQQTQMPQKVGGYIEEYIDTPTVILGVLLIDETGSEAANRDKIIAGCNMHFDYLRKSKERRKIQLEVITFGTKPRIVQEFRPLINEADPTKAIQDLTRASYNPGGNTAFWDAMRFGLGRAEYFRKAIHTSKEAEVERVVFLATGDALDNWSDETALSEVRDFIVKRSGSELWSIQFFGIADPVYVADVAIHMGHDRRAFLEKTSVDDQLAFADRMFKGFIGGGDPDMEKAIYESCDKKDKHFVPGVGGVGLRRDLVMTVNNDPASIYDLFGTKMSSSFTAGSAGAVTTKAGSVSQAVAAATQAAQNPTGVF